MVTFLIVAAVIGFMTYGFDRRVCSQPLRLDVAFEFVKRSTVHKVFQSKTSITTGDATFDDIVYVGSDIPEVSGILSNERIRGLILNILHEAEVAGVYVRNNQIYVKLHLFKQGSDRNTETLTQLLKSAVQELTEKFAYELNKVQPTKLTKSSQYDKRIKTIGVLSFIGVSTSLAAVMTNHASRVGDYYYAQGFSLWSALLTSAIIVTTSIAFIWMLIRKSTRIHLLSNQLAFQLFPASLLAGVLILNIVNIALDTSVPTVSTETVTVKAWSGGKGTNFDIYIKYPQNPLLSDMMPMRIERDTAKSLQIRNEVKIATYAGYFSVPYVKFNPDN